VYDTGHRPDPRRVRGLLVRLASATFVAVTVACGSDTPAAGVASANGAVLYSEHCASCHGADLRGSDEGPSQLSVVYEPNHHGDDSYRRAIRFGVAPHHWNFGTMPPNDELGDAEIEAIIAFVRSEQARRGFEPYPP
jgi:mono/diheme cytochrome c family protein